MPDFNACFVSYRHPNDKSAKRFVGSFVDALRAQLQLNLPDAKIFFDTDGLRVGDLYNEELALQICRSACLVICYGPRYFDPSHPYCTREYLAMRLLEERRRRYMSEYLGNNGLVFPVVFRGLKSMPQEIVQRRQCIQFDDVLRPEDFHTLSRLERIRLLADEIYECCDEIERSGFFAEHDCTQFTLPAEEADRWLSENARRERTPMPGR
jgi:hypothetical protein